MEDVPPGEKVAILLQALNRQLGEIERREGREQQIFEWSTGLLLAAFGAVIALSDRAEPLPCVFAVKSLATLLIAVPTGIFAVRIQGYGRRSVENAEAVERIEALLRFYDDGFYGPHSPYPPRWEGKFAGHRRRRTTPLVYSTILMLMAGCVVAAVWLIL